MSLEQKIASAKYALCAHWENVLHEIHVIGTIGGPLYNNAKEMVLDEGY